ncbi:MAG: NADH-quinone oxidoreductase subunit K [Elusimicrobia bacterium]|nr:NADH-quinone oxidoreductase subunit K [Elusimicrobiota bacterium]
MSLTNPELLRIFIIFIVLLIVIGFYYILATRNLIRILLGLEIITKAVTLAIIVVGYITNNMPLAQSLVIIIIIIEVFVIAIAAGVIIRIYKHTDSIDVRNIKTLKG